MLQVSQDQLDHLASDRVATFLADLVKFLDVRFPQKAPPQHSEKEALVDESCDEARNFGLSSKQHLRLWLQLRLVHGADFLDLPWARPVAVDTVLSPVERITLIEERALLQETAG